MYCRKCGNEIEENIQFCPYCGNKVEKIDMENSQEEINSNEPNENSVDSDSIEAKTIQNDSVKIEKKKKRKATTKLVIGIISMVVSLLILFQSCAAGLYNTFSDTGDLGGSAGILVFALILAAGIVSVASRKSEKKGSSIAILIMYSIGALFAFPNSAVFTDLKIWGWMCVIFGLYFLYDVLPVGKNNDSENKPIVEVKCNNCGTKVGVNDTVCPNCGTKITNKAKTISIIKTIGSIIIGLIIISIIIYSISSSITEKKEIKESTSVPLSDIKVQSEEETSTEAAEPEYKYVGDVLDYMTSDVLNENVEIDGIAVLVSMGMEGTSDCTMQVVLRDEDWNSTISLNGINDADIENHGLEDGDYCTVKGYIYYDEYDAPAIDVHDIQVR